MSVSTETYPTFSPKKTHKDYLNEVENRFGKENVKRVANTDVKARHFLNLLIAGNGPFPHSLACDLSRRVSITSDKAN